MVPMKLFISGPLSDGGTADMETMINNVNKAVEVGIECIKKGHHPFIPHLSLYTHSLAEKQGYEIPWETWMRIDLAFLQECDGIVFIGSSKGSEIELMRARKWGLKVFNSVDEIPQVKPFVPSKHTDSPY